MKYPKIYQTLKRISGAVIVLLLLAGPLRYSLLAQQPDEREAFLRQTAEQVFREQQPSLQNFEVGLTEIVGDWAMVNFRVSPDNPVDNNFGWIVYVGLGQWDGTAWTVALEGSAEFLAWLDQIPEELIPLEARHYLKPEPVVSGAPGLWLPFPVGQTWKYLAGPNGGPRREAVDFGPFQVGERPSPTPPPPTPLTGQERDVTAAAAGVVVDRDRNLLILRHGAPPAWETGYASLAADSNTRPLWQVINQGERIGAASAETEPQKGVHVHFWVSRERVNQSIAGQVLSDWQVYQDNGFAVGQNAGRLVYQNGSEIIDCPTVERNNLPGTRCHVPHFSATPAPLPDARLALVSGPGVTTIQVLNATNLARVNLQLTYAPPAIINVVDAFPDTPAIEVIPGAIFNNVPVTIIENSVNPARGVIAFRVERQVPAPAFTGNGPLLTITWRRLAPGAANVRLNQAELLDPNGQIIPVAIPNNSAVIQQGFVLQGQVALQGRSQAGGVTVDTTSQQVQTDATGQFVVGVPENYLLTITAPGYLTTQVMGQLTGSASDIVAIGQIPLLAGDVTGDNRIDIFDLAAMYSHYGGNNPLADINADGVVNTLDLALIASNYGRQGPLVEQR